jgi:hypothetical protein
MAILVVARFETHDVRDNGRRFNSVPEMYVSLRLNVMTQVFYLPSRNSCYFYFLKWGVGGGGQLSALAWTPAYAGILRFPRQGLDLMKNSSFPDQV